MNEPDQLATFHQTIGLGVIKAPEIRVIYSTHGIACNKACCKHE